MSRILKKNTFPPLKGVSKWYGTIRIRNQIRIHNSVVLIRNPDPCQKMSPRDLTLAKRTLFFHRIHHTKTIGSDTCPKRTLFFPTPSFHHIGTTITAKNTIVKIQLERHYLPEPPPTKWLLVPPQLSRHCHAILLAPVRVRAMWRWSSSMQL
jgi:hypothetical protein